MNGGVGDDELRAGYGHKILDGGVREDSVTEVEAEENRYFYLSKRRRT